MALRVLVSGGLIQLENLVWKKHSTRCPGCTKTKKTQALLSSFRRTGKEVTFVTLPLQLPTLLGACQPNLSATIS